jgi:siroheme synthase-like protein
MPFPYPVFLDLTGVPVLVVGGGAIALRKATGLVDAGAVVTVVAPVVVPELAHLVAQVHVRRYADGEAASYQLVITATDDAAVNARVAADARGAQVWANSADDPQNCSFILPAVARASPLSVAVSSDGASPALAGWVRDRAKAVLSDEVVELAHELAQRRAAIHAAGGSTEEVDWASIIDSTLSTQPPACRP